MSRGRIALTVLLGVVLGFFLAVGTIELVHREGSPSAPVASSDAAKVPATTAMSVAYGKAQAKTHTAGVKTAPIVPFIRTLSDTKKSNAACPCVPVTEMQRALIAAKFRPAKAKTTGTFGNATREEIKAFQRAKKIPASGVYGAVTHHQLAPFYSAASRGRLEQFAHTRKVAAIRAAIVKVINHSVALSSQFGYSEGVSRIFLPRYPLVPRGTDCSGFVTWVMRSVGLPDPSGFAYRVIGYTGTLALHGTKVSLGHLMTGDLIFYGGGYPYGHVAIVDDGFLRTVASHGSPGVKILPYNYRRDVSAARRYF